MVHKVTYVPAKHFGLTGLGELREGCTADLNLLTLDACEEEIADSIGDTIILKNKITVRKTIYSKGEESEYLEKALEMMEIDAEHRERTIREYEAAKERIKNLPLTLSDDADASSATTWWR